MAENQATGSIKFENQATEILKCSQETLKQVGYVTGVNSLMAV